MKYNITILSMAHRDRQGRVDVVLTENLELVLACLDREGPCRTVVELSCATPLDSLNEAISLVHSESVSPSVSASLVSSSPLLSRDFPTKSTSGRKPAICLQAAAQRQAAENNIVASKKRQRPMDMDTDTRGFDMKATGNDDAPIRHASYDTIVQLQLRREVGTMWEFYRFPCLLPMFTCLDIQNGIRNHFARPEYLGWAL